MTMTLRMISGLTLAGMLAACGGSSFEETARTSPEFLLARTNDGQITGTYNPAGYTPQNVRAALRATCKDNRISNLAQQPKDDLMVYSASCPSGSVGNGHYIFEKQGNQLNVEGTISDGSGNLNFVKKTVPAV